MQAVSIHLIFNHLPVFGSLLATVIFAFGLLRKQQDIIRLSLYLFIFSALATLPVFFSGEGAEEAVEHLPGVAESLIEAHEDLAKFALGLIEVLGLASIGALMLSFRQQTLPRWGAGLIAVLALGNSAVMAQTAHLGGQIRHSEIRPAASAGQQNIEDSDSPRGAADSDDVQKGLKAADGNDLRQEQKATHADESASQNSAEDHERTEQKDAD